MSDPEEVLLLSLAPLLPTAALTVPVMAKGLGMRLPESARRACGWCGVATLDTLLAVPGVYLLLCLPFATAHRIGAALGLIP